MLVLANSQPPSDSSLHRNFESELLKFSITSSSGFLLEELGSVMSRAGLFIELDQSEDVGSGEARRGSPA